MTGAEITAKAVQCARWNGVKVHYRYKSADLPGDADRGFTDAVFAGPGGIIFAEMKGDGDRLSPAQVEWGELLALAEERSGRWVTYVVWTPQDWASKRIEHEIERIGKEPE